jgi:23S rRNA (uridine2552-2'-O)-methyltransferase
MTYKPKDAYYRKAKEEGYRSRAAYKLLELNRRFHLIRPGQRIVDLGAAPGGWLQVASRLAGQKGCVIGIDIQPIQSFKEKNISVLCADIASADSQGIIRELLGSPADCVISDLSPRLSGIHDVDVSRSIQLAQVALKVACSLLKPGGTFLVKTFTGEETAAFAKEIQSHFDSLQRTRPEATRKGSSEIYLIARGFRGGS